ncbi:MAG: HAD-IC family P-type ATPase, partial [Candidatus Uhrbacteria bacterium]|nr:HAD-IC family P-type ATPase [Candidatus Uhrbacteria bacterium]
MFHPEMTHQPFWSMEVLDVLKVLKTPLEGLSEEEVLRRRAVTGLNLFRDGAGDSSLRILLRQFQSPFIIVLLLAAILTFVLKEWVDAAVILAAITANTILGFWQEQKAETVLEKLKSYIQIHVRVRRRGREKEVDASELVPGDVIRLSRGDRVPADARLIQVTGLEVDESVLTGESLPVVKRIESVDLSTILPERVSMVYGGTLVQQGFAEAMITVTGYHTEFGKIAALVKAGDQDKTPLQRAVQKFSATLGKIFLFFMGVLFFLGLAVGYPLFDMLLLKVAVAVSVIPEGLPIALTVILAVGVERLAKRKGIVKKLLAAETLGSTSIILTDKTGTLTKAQMQLVAVLPYKHDEEAEAQQHLLQDALINLEAMIENPDDAPAEWRVSGRPMETALVREAGIRGVHLPVVLRTVTFVERLPFRSDTKYSAALVSSGSKLRAVIFGAPDILLRFTHLSDQEKRELHQEIERRALSGERVLGVISKVITDVKEFAQNHAWHEYVFEGLLTFRDPLRSGVKEAIARMAKAGVKTVIVTGDHRGTAEAVAREIGLIDGEGAVITGDELAAFSPEELDGFLPRIHVFARVTPEQKMFL